jgi:16S rRNA (adenine1518-N6/adenine1519-N6)-dimethyltransferase
MRKHVIPSHIRLNTLAGQHILVDDDVLSRMVRSADVPLGEAIIEPGAGLGALTEALAEDRQEKDSAVIVAVERDTRFIPHLRKRLKQFPCVRIHAGDILDLLPRTVLPSSQPYHVVGNIPYAISARLIRHVLSWNPAPVRITFLIDNEVAKRVTSTPPHANLLSVSVEVFAEAHIIKNNIPPEVFIPQPKVQSAILQLTPRSTPLVPPEKQKHVFDNIRKGFAQRRKMLKNSVGEHVAVKAGIDPSRRPQTLSVEEWVALAHAQEL